MLHESPHSKPETIEQRKIVFHHVRVWVAGMRVVPLVGAEPTEGESRDKRVSTRNIGPPCADETPHKRYILKQREWEQRARKLRVAGPQAERGGGGRSFWLLRRSTYRHIQMPSVYSQDGSIGWNNSVTADNVPQPAGSRAHLDSLTQEPIRDCICNHSYSDDATTCAVNPPPPQHSLHASPSPYLLFFSPQPHLSSPYLISLLITALPLQSFHFHPG